MAEAVPDALVLDLMMPGVDGFQVLEEIRATDATRELPVLVLTAKELTAADRGRLSANHVRGLVQKGQIDRDALVARVRALLGAAPRPLPRREECREAHGGTGAAAPEPAEPGARRGPQPGGRLVLVVEDNPDNRFTLGQLLDAAGYPHAAAEDGAAALAAIRETHPALVLMDIHLPVLGGEEVLARLRADPDLAATPVVAVTARAMKGDRERFLALGFDGYLAKPLEADSLREVLRTWVST